MCIFNDRGVEGMNGRKKRSGVIIVIVIVVMAAAFGAVFGLHKKYTDLKSDYHFAELLCRKF